MTDQTTPPFRNGPPIGDDMVAFAEQANKAVLARVASSGVGKAPTLAAGSIGSLSQGIEARKERRLVARGRTQDRAAWHAAEPALNSDGTTVPTITSRHPVRNVSLALVGMATALTAIVLVGSSLLGIKPGMNGPADDPGVSAGSPSNASTSTATPIPTTGSVEGSGVVPVTSGSGAVAVVRQTPYDGGFDARIYGVVALLNDACVGISRGDNFALAEWPAGTTFLPGDAGLSIPGYGDLPFGSTIEAGGGSSTVAGSRGEDLLPPGCDTNDRVTVNDYSPKDSASPIPKAGPTGYPKVLPMTSGSGAVALVRQSIPDFMPEARITGTVEVLGGSCVGLRSGNSFELVEWPAGTTFLPDDAGLSVPGYGDLPFGSILDTGGGGRSVADSAIEGLLPAGCDINELVTVND